MKYFKFSMLFVLLASFTLFFNSCEETTSTGDDPYIDSIEPSTGSPGDVVILYGSNFGDYDQYSSGVYFGDDKADVVVDGTEIQWWDDEIQVYVPDNAKSGYVYVDVNGVTSNYVYFTVPSVDPAENLMATSINATTVALKWDLSADDGESYFLGYKLSVSELSGSLVKEEDLNSGVNTATVDELTEGTIYVFEIEAKGNFGDGVVYSESIVVNWSPATRFTENINEEPIKMYGSESSFGSGLELYNEAGGAPKGLKVTSGDDWDLGLYTRSGVVEIGSAAEILAKYSYSGTPKTCEISSTTYEVNSLDEVYDSQALDEGHVFSEQIIDLNDFTGQKNVVLIVRTLTGTTWNYAKVMVLYNGGFLQGTGDNEYIEVQVSYQKGPGVPYAF
jgi:hypothetical protein